MQQLVDGAPFVTWYNFISAIAKAPGFCDGIPGGMYSQFSGNEMCRKEFAAMIAVLISQYNANDDTLLDTTGAITGTVDEVIPKYLQGFASYQDTNCDEPSELTSDYCMYAGADMSMWDDFYMMLTESSSWDPNGVGLVPRGAGAIYGID